MSERTVLQSMSRRDVLSLGPLASVRDAACAMTRANCGSVLVIDGAGPMVGILTERDLMTRVLAKGLDADATPVTQVMTRNPRCIAPALSMTSTLPQLARVIAQAASWTVAAGTRLRTWRWRMDCRTVRSGMAEPPGAGAGGLSAIRR